jgi:hypothetical protein
VALGLVPLGTSAVQAEEGANWKVNGKSITATLLPEVQVTSVENNVMALLFTTKGGTKTSISCKTAAFIGAKLGIEGKVSENKIKFSGCTTELNSKLSSQCQPRTEGELGVATSNKVIGLLVLHEGKTLIRFEPVTPETFINLELGEECSIGGVCPIKGKLTLVDPAIGSELIEHLVQEGPLTSLTALGVPGTIDGSATIRLVGSHTGLQWSGSAG